MNTSIQSYKLKKTSKSTLISVIKAAYIIGFCFIILYPILTMISKAFMSRTDILDNSVILIPRNFTLENFKIASMLMEYPNTLLNSLVLSVVCTMLQLMACLMAGYAFGRYASKMKNILFGFVILTIIIPPQLVMLPMFMQFRFFDILGIFKTVLGQPVNLIDSFYPFWFLSITANGCKNGLFIFIFRQFFRNMPKEIEEASMVDGAGSFRTFFTIMLPNAVTSIVTVALFSFVWQYNDVMYSTIFLPTKKVLPLVYHSLERFTTEVLNYMGASSTDISMNLYVPIVKCTGVLLMLAPVMIIYFIFQRYFIESVERSGITGQ